jgi:hypothetical protein
MIDLHSAWRWRVLLTLTTELDSATDVMEKAAPAG